MAPFHLADRKILLIFFLFSAFAISCLGQSKFQNAYYITWDDDTVNGLISNKGGSGNSLSCTFKKDESSAVSKLSAEDIKAYRFADGQYYVSKEIDIKGTSSKVFVEFLVDGISNLYFYRDLENYFYLVENQNGDLIALYKEEVNNLEGHANVSHDTYRHIRMLKLAFSDCMEIQPQVEEAQLTHKSLINLTKNYHDYVCEDQECIVYEKEVGPTRINFAPVIGYSVSRLQFDREFYSRFSYESSQNLSIGLQIDAVLTRIHENVSLQLDFLYENTEFYGTYNNYYQLFISNNLFQSSLLVKYRFAGKKVRPTLGLGLLGNFVLETKADAIIDNNQGSSPTERVIEDIYMAKNLIGVVAQFGLNYRIFKKREAFTNIRYAYSQGTASGFNQPVKTTISSLNLSVGMYLSKVD